VRLRLSQNLIIISQVFRSGKGKDRADVAVIDDDAVYLEDLDSDMARSPEKSPTKPSTSTPAAPSPTKVPFRDHDLYRLPELDLTAAIAKAANSARPDARLATEDELRSFIEDMRPEDFDVSSAEFQALPTEVQFEVIADLRVRSRQTSYKRLQQMLRNAPTALDFSREQIKGLQQRNSLTQQLLETSGMVSKDEISITVRIASERNKQYVLTKNEGPGGGWVLGRISDEGTSKAKAIRVDGSSDHEVEEVAPGDDDSDDMDMEEVEMYVAPINDNDYALKSCRSDRCRYPWTPTFASFSVRTRSRQSPVGAPNWTGRRKLDRRRRSSCRLARCLSLITTTTTTTICCQSSPRPTLRAMTRSCNGFWTSLATTQKQRTSGRLSSTRRRTSRRVLPLTASAKARKVLRPRTRQALAWCSRRMMMRTCTRLRSGCTLPWP
jgi:hypothetical protein